jgi:hypothetical protein
VRLRRLGGVASAGEGTAERAGSDVAVGDPLQCRRMGRAAPAAAAAEGGARCAGLGVAVGCSHRRLSQLARAQRWVCARSRRRTSRSHGVDAQTLEDAYMRTLWCGRRPLRGGTVVCLNFK